MLLLVYAALVVYASLYPLSGWREPAGPALAFVTAPWPRYLTAFDLWANMLGYLPLGMLCVWVLRPRIGAGKAATLAILAGAALSLALETLQVFIPARYASNVDLLANACGAAAGAITGLRLESVIRGGGPLDRLRTDALGAGSAADIGLTLLGLWLFAQLNPMTLPFGSGDLRDLFAGAAGERHGVELFVSVEAVTAAANLVAVALLAMEVAREGASRRLRGTLLAVFLFAALLVKTFAFAILMRAEHVLAWLTPGAQLGLLAGVVFALPALWLPRVARLALAAMLLMAATVLVNLAPPNPYIVATLKVWEQGHFLNFNGLTRLVSALWPFAALGYLVWLAASRLREPLR